MTLVRSLSALGLMFALAACPGAKMPGGGGGGNVDPNACGDWKGVSDDAAKLYAFLDSTAKLQATVKAASVEVRTGCDAMAKELGIEPKGDNKAVCDAVFKQLQDDLSAGIQADAQLTIDYKPAVCTVSVDAAASAAAECEARAGGSASVSCEGTCHGTCDGTCEGSTGDGGECEGQCNGTCSGDCEGSADVEASAECKAEAEVHASAEVQCTPAELSVEADASIVVDQPRTDRAIAAMKAGLPQILTIKEKITPISAAAEAWIAASGDAIAAGKSLAKGMKDQALCLGAQLNAAASAVASIKAEVSFSVEVSASASGSVASN